MDICGKHYSGSIAFEGSICPACDQIEDLQNEIEDLKDNIKNLKGDHE